MNAEQRSQAHKDLKDDTIIVRSMDIEHMSADPSLNGHQTSSQR